MKSTIVEHLNPEFEPVAVVSESSRSRFERPADSRPVGRREPFSQTSDGRGRCLVPPVYGHGAAA